MDEIVEPLPQHGRAGRARDSVRSATGENRAGSPKAAERVLVLGPCGAGKSTLAIKLGEKWGLPVVHLDQEYWRSGWLAPPESEWLERVEALIARPRWIMDGNYGGTLARRLQRAQLVVNLDYPRSVFFPRMLWRLVSQFGRVRGDMAPGCPERFDWEFVRYTWRYRIDVLPRRLERLAAAGVPVLNFRNPAETDRWLAAGASLDPLLADPERGPV